jgi:ABC-type lipoprotein release transport system permease subunit
MNRLNLYFIEFAFSMLVKNIKKSIFIFAILSILVFILVSVFHLSHLIQKQSINSINDLPQLIIQDNTGGFLRPIDEKIVFDILQIKGVLSAQSRVWGIYNFKSVNFTVVGIDPFEKSYKQEMSKLAIDTKLFQNINQIIIGSDVKKTLEKFYFQNQFHFILPDGKIQKVKIINSFAANEVLQSDLIFLNKTLAKKILGIENNKATDISVLVANNEEIDTIKFKIESSYPNLTILSNESIKREYSQMIDYKGGFFISLYLIALLTFFIIIFDKLMSNNSNEKKEIAILKAIGWSTNNILQVKFYEAFYLSFIAFLLGVIGAFIYIYFFDAYFIKDLFINYAGVKYNFILDFSINFEILLLVFLLTVPIYILATIYPSWRVAISDVDEVLR